MMKSKTNNGRIALICILIAASLLVFWPALRWMFNSWLSSDYYSHGFLVPVISGYFIWSKRENLKYQKFSYFSVGLFCVSVILYLLSYLLFIRVLGILSLLCVIWGVVLAIWGVKGIKILIFPLVFLLFMVPFWFIQDLANNLQYISVHWAAYIVDMLGLPISTVGNEIHLGNITFTVGIVCSGINTLVALMALSAVYAYILKGSILKRLVLFVLAFPIAIAANILRISTIIMFAYVIDLKAATGWYHDISSPVFFFLAFLVLILISRLMKLKINYDIFGQKK
jgi:exosortase